MQELYDLKEMLVDELKEYGKKGELSSGTLEVVDKLSHAAKNLCKIIEAYEMEDGYSEYSMYGNSYGYDYENSNAQGGNRGGGNRGGGNSSRNSYRNSYARGRGANARRDAMGRYSSAEDEISGMVDELRELMRDLPAEKQREVHKFISKMEQM